MALTIDHKITVEPDTICSHLADCGTAEALQYFDTLKARPDIIMGLMGASREDIQAKAEAFKTLQKLSKKQLENLLKTPKKTRSTSRNKPNSKKK